MTVSVVQQSYSTALTVVENVLHTDEEARNIEASLGERKATLAETMDRIAACRKGIEAKQDQAKELIGQIQSLQCDQSIVFDLARSNFAKDHLFMFVGDFAKVESLGEGNLRIIYPDEAGLLNHDESNGSMKMQILNKVLSSVNAKVK